MRWKQFKYFPNTLHSVVYFHINNFPLFLILFITKQPPVPFPAHSLHPLTATGMNYSKWKFLIKQNYTFMDRNNGFSQYNVLPQIEISTLLLLSWMVKWVYALLRVWGGGRPFTTIHSSNPTHSIPLSSKGIALTVAHDAKSRA